jgi:hypothetical protein
MDTQTLLTVAAVLGPLIGVALGAFLARRHEERHWFRDRRLDAFVAAQTAAYGLISAVLYAATYREPPKDDDETAKQFRLEATTEVRVAATQWGEARERLDLLAGGTVVSAMDELHETVRAMASGAIHDDREWDPAWIEAAKKIRTRLTLEMRKELKTS